MAPLVIRQGAMYLNHDGEFLAYTIEDALTFDTLEEIDSFVTTRDVVTVEHLASAVAREDQEYAMQLEDLRG